MREINAVEARDKISALLDAVEHGEEILITRRGKPVAKLVSVRAAPDRNRASAAADRIKALRRGVTVGDGLTLKETIEEGR
tara:strand:- start:214 stop:456 length:243 start_codon:yes stop_codon:yes gene_type:complete